MPSGAVRLCSCRWVPWAKSKATLKMTSECRQPFAMMTCNESFPSRPACDTRTEKMSLHTRRAGSDSLSMLCSILPATPTGNRISRALDPEQPGRGSNIRRAYAGPDAGAVCDVAGNRQHRQQNLQHRSTLPGERTLGIVGSLDNRLHFLHSLLDFTPSRVPSPCKVFGPHARDARFTSSHHQSPRPRPVSHVVKDA